jgi:hypothetical protein
MTEKTSQVTHEPTVSPIPEITEQHVNAAEIAADVAEGRGWRVREAQENLVVIRSLSSGQRVVVNPETHATIPKWQIDRVKALIIDRLWPTSPPVNDAVFLELKGMFAGWLSARNEI